MPLALFIIVVMGVLALTISRTAIQTQNTSIQEYTNVQAFYAAESGAQRGMQRLFFNTDITRASVTTRCTNLNETFNLNTINGLRSCTAQVRCVAAADVTNVSTFYRITSVGQCGQNEFISERTIEVGAHQE
ncbi:MAG: MSHA biogenesis protein MshP [Cellvibrio sp.]|uniref:pilus assembly PilX N-terminal domain-containing protein n=1 Tax=Cellvibrio sp. TaxID=1965322 RepID=UPI0031AB075D